jgi:hypothetical protein
VILCAAAHDLCGDDAALCGEARRSTTNTWRVLEWQHLSMQALTNAFAALV